MTGLSTLIERLSKQRKFFKTICDNRKAPNSSVMCLSYRHNKVKHIIIIIVAQTMSIKDNRFCFSLQIKLYMFVRKHLQSTEQIRRIKAYFTIITRKIYQRNFFFECAYF